jgi:hypothetical protein
MPLDIGSKYTALISPKPAAESPIDIVSAAAASKKCFMPLSYDALSAGDAGGAP